MSAGEGASLRVGLLGPVQAWRGETELELGSAHRRAVLAVLAMSANRAVSRAELIDAVWGEAAPARADGSIYTYVSSIRRALDPDRPARSAGQVLVSVDSGYSLRLDQGALDVDRFNTWRDQAQRCWSAGDLQGALRALDSAEQLWRGEALAGISGPFATAQRARLTELRLACLERRAEVRLALGRHREIVPELVALADEHPLREALRGLLMLALYRCGRRDEALAVFEDVRANLVETSGTEPGVALSRLRERILADDPTLTNATALPGPNQRPPAPALPRPSTACPRHPEPPAGFVGRTDEVDLLRSAVAALTTGRGHTVWIDGEPGAGKSALLAQGLAEADALGCQVRWGVCDELGQRFPLRVLLDCLGLDAPVTAPGLDDAVLAAVDRVVALVTESCVDTPLVLVVDDLQWADQATLLVWQRLCLASRRLPLLLVGACRPIPRRPELDRLRSGLVEAGAEVLSLAPLPEPVVHRMLGEIVGAPAGPGLGRLAATAAGNPLYVRKLVHGLVRDGSVLFDGACADIDPAAPQVISPCLAATVDRHLAVLSDQTRELLRWAALFGTEFPLADAAVALGRPASELVDLVDEAFAAGLLVESGERLVFRHPLIRRVLYERAPTSVRIALHRQVAQALAEAGAPADRVANQLTAAPVPVDSWVRDWLLANVGVVANRAPHAAVDLLRNALDQEALATTVRETFTATLARLLFWLGREPEAEARYVIARTADSQRAAEMRWILAYVHYRRGEVDRAVDNITAALHDTSVNELWRGRHQALLDLCRRSGRHHAPGQPDRGAAPTDRGAEPAWDLAGLNILGLCDKSAPWREVDSLDDAARALSSARQLASTRALPGEVHVVGAVHYYWLGRWDEALAELCTVTRDGPETTSYVLRRPGSAMLLRGVAALIAGHRDDQNAMRMHLQAAGHRAGVSPNDVDCAAFLLMATALGAEQQGRPTDALNALTLILQPGIAPLTGHHGWLPSMARLAMSVGDQDRAELALRLCQAEAERERSPARLGAAARCQGLVTGDPDPVLAAADHYRAAGRTLELAWTMEDAAVLLGERGRLAEARAALHSALAAYTDMGAAWDVRRAEARMRPFGIRRLTPLRRATPDEPPLAAAEPPAILSG